MFSPTKITASAASMVLTPLRAGSGRTWVGCETRKSSDHRRLSAFFAAAAATWDRTLHSCHLCHSAMWQLERGSRLHFDRVLDGAKFTPYEHPQPYGPRH